jgi:hypothetical protein
MLQGSATTALMRREGSPSDPLRGMRWMLQIN